MRATIKSAAFALAMAAFAGSACAMTEPKDSEFACQVIDGDKLPPESGGADLLCATIRQAAEAHGLADGFAVEVRVESPAMLSAVVISPDGRRLPEQKFASSDRQLRQSSFERFARSIIGAARSTGS